VLLFHNLGTSTHLKESDSESLTSEQSHSSIDNDMSVAQLKDFLYEKLLEKKKVNVNGKAPSMDEFRTLFDLVKHVKSADEDFRRTAPRIIITRFRILFTLYLSFDRILFY
jgi:hypothetical protein